MEATYTEETAPQDLTLLFQKTREMIVHWKASGRQTKQGGRPLLFCFPAKQ